MYLRAIHAENSIPALRQLIKDYPLGILTTAIASTSQPFIQSSHIPWVLDVQDDSSETELGVLRGHLARANPQSKTMIESLSADNRTRTGNVLDQEVLVLFTAPTHHYVTPKFYTETKPTTGKVVPTWNYAAVQAYGRAKIYYESKSEETSSFLARQIHDLSQHGEISVMGYTGKGDSPGPWKVTDAPERYIELSKMAIVGIEITIDRLQGKFKMSQELNEGDREGVVKGFKALESAVGSSMSDLVRERGELKQKSKQ
ncbi:transcriptional protein [Colletotrichum tofieldiae]|uniref:Transcriptional protein n=1 Tax=Colletotrichum tofieldiae TaxID=708197 RepID=A0A166WMI7_9PEZI|nr:transcriptional protein [Colletotrichum tofieldiae]GKT96319.1 transcriptional protein [Colletotrichum tofieldiae]